MIEAGTFRPDALAIGARAGCHPSAVMRHYGALHLLYRVIAREHEGAVLEAMGLTPADDPCTAALQTDLVWIAMTGERKPR